MNEVKRVEVPAYLETFDEDIIQESADLFEARFPSVIADFLEDAEAYYEAIRRGLQENDLDSVVRAAHPLKSASGSMGAISLFEAARAIELNTRCVIQEGGDSGELESILPKLAEALSVAKGKFQKIASAV